MSPTQVATYPDSFETGRKVASTRRFGGTGLACPSSASCFGLGGEIFPSKAKPGKGTTIRVSLPLPAAECSPCTRNRPYRRTSSSKDVRPGSPAARFVADDNLNQTAIVIEEMPQRDPVFDIGHGRKRPRGSGKRGSPVRRKVAVRICACGYFNAFSMDGVQRVAQIRLLNITRATAAVT